MWPAIWMLPENSTYGTWPQSGEIDVSTSVVARAIADHPIVESRGNNISYSTYGSDYITSALHWGPTPALDYYFKTWSIRHQKLATYSAGYHTYGLEWNDKYITTCE